MIALLGLFVQLFLLGIRLLFVIVYYTVRVYGRICKYTIVKPLKFIIRMIGIPAFVAACAVTAAPVLTELCHVYVPGYSFMRSLPLASLVAPIAPTICEHLADFGCFLGSSSIGILALAGSMLAMVTVFPFSIWLLPFLTCTDVMVIIYVLGIIGTSIRRAHRNAKRKQHCRKQNGNTCRNRYNANNSGRRIGTNSGKKYI